MEAYRASATRSKNKCQKSKRAGKVRSYNLRMEIRAQSFRDRVVLGDDEVHIVVKAVAERKKN